MENKDVLQCRASTYRPHVNQKITHTHIYTDTLCKKRHVNLKKLLFHGKFSHLHESEFYHKKRQALKMDLLCRYSIAASVNLRIKRFTFFKTTFSSLSKSKWLTTCC